MTSISGPQKQVIMFATRIPQVMSSTAKQNSNKRDTLLTYSRQPKKFQVL